MDLSWGFERAASTFSLSQVFSVFPMGMRQIKRLSYGSLRSRRSDQSRYESCERHLGSRQPRQSVSVKDFFRRPAKHVRELEEVTLGGPCEEIRTSNICVGLVA
jgi:hypothetical protein